ncbi:hypothetical protein CORMATOL_00852 [Corynebacterium matruchotii ATCC 33806]|uniref:Uncharacterized protein n=1 Tax=Corynebacterium matruchotii ATCC 33806 TaxID=566549 RepID=C0E1K1_9CORY|nr:hypothetical protein CORMATOL_00852 [Corynebacterium matruchotii ATCC 33806]
MILSPSLVLRLGFRCAGQPPAPQPQGFTGAKRGFCVKQRPVARREPETPLRTFAVGDGVWQHFR